MLPRVGSADALLATGHAPRDGCITGSRSLTSYTLRHSLYVRYRSFGPTLCHRAAARKRNRIASQKHRTIPNTARSGVVI